MTPLRDKRHGRIYRVVPADGAPGPARDLSGASADELVAALADDNLFWRLTAQRLLIERGARDVEAALCALVERGSLDDLGLAPGPLHALYALDGLGAIDELSYEVEEALVTALRHPARAVRRAALDLLPRERWALEVVLSGRLLDDPDPHVRLAALLALAEMPPSEAAGRAVLAALEEPANLGDRWIPDAATSAAARHDAGFLKAFLAGVRSEPEAPAERRGRTNLLANASLERGAEEPEGWAVRHYSGEARHVFATDGRGGRSGRSLRIDSGGGADSSWHQYVDVEPGATYRLSGWIRAEGVEPGSGLGALFNVHEIQGARNARTEPVTGTTGWTRVEVTFDSGSHRRVSINCLFGGWGQSRGTAFFDDVALERVDDPLAAGPLGQIVSRVARSYARRGPVGSVVSTVTALGDLPAGVAELFLEGLAGGWPAGAAPELTAADRAALGQLLGRLDGGARSQLLQLAERWGRGDVFAADAGAVLDELRSAVAGGELSTGERVVAAERLVRLADSAESARAVLEQLGAGTEPELAGGLVGALAASRRAETGAELLGRWDALSPAAQRAGVRLLSRRDPWTRALLEAIEAGAIPPALVEPSLWARLEQHPDPELARLAAGARGRPANEDGEALVARYAGALERAGDAGRGRQLFAEHCASCHVFQGAGTRVGPDLDGIGARPAGELLIEILDPSRSIERNYQMWYVQTVGGLHYGGRLVAETRSAVELLEGTGESRVLDREEIELIWLSELSLMPSGFESLGEEGLADLLEYLREPE